MAKQAELKVVSGGKNIRARKKKQFDADAFYDKYPWVVKNSVKEVEPGTIVDGVKVAHGRICKIKCQETGKTRTVNVQDAWQIKYTKEVQKRLQQERASQRRKAQPKKPVKKAKAS